MILTSELPSTQENKGNKLYSSYYLIRENIISSRKNKLFSLKLNSKGNLKEFTKEA